MNMLTEFQTMAAICKRKQQKSIEDEAIIAACDVIEFWFDVNQVPASERAHIFDMASSGALDLLEQ